VNIQAVAQRTGIPAATLRKWEQRYGVLAPERTPGAHRRYSERDVLRVEWLKARLAEGYRIGEAARLLGDGGLAPAPPSSDPRDLVSLLLEGARSTDPACVERAVEQAFVLLGAERAIGEVIEPALRTVGELWERGELGVGQEHAASTVVRTKLQALVQSGAEGPRGRAVLCCAPGERHELGLLALGVLLQADGWGIVYLGPDTPLADALAVARARGASLLCVSATMPESAEAAGAWLDEVSAEDDVSVVVGGAAFESVGADVRDALRPVPA